MTTNEILTEKYRPSRLDDIIGQNNTINKLKEYALTKNMPNLLFNGFSGTGKTTSAIALAKEIYGNESWRSNFMELNASDENGIDTIRGKIKDYAGTKSMEMFPFTIIFFDEADALTNPAQSALRRTMEKYTKSCRFILSCNYISKIIPAIQSRCSIFTFKKISKEDVVHRIAYICQKENIIIETTALEAIAYSSNGDLRNAIGILDKSRTLNNTININNIYQIVTIDDENNIKEIINKSLKGDYLSAFIIAEQVLSNGIETTEILRMMSQQTIDMNIEPKMKMEIISLIGETSWRCNYGINELMQLKWLIAEITKLGIR